MFGEFKLYFYIGLITIALLSFGGYSYYLYNKGYSVAEAKCQAEALQEQLKSKERDLAVIKKKAEEEVLARKKLQENSDSLQKQHEEYAATVEQKCKATEEDEKHFNGKFK